MSMELHAFLSKTRLPDRLAWENATRALGLPIQFHNEFRPDKARGFCPITIDGNQAGCEIDCGLETVDSLQEAYEALGALDAEQLVISFRFGGEMEEGACATAAAAGLASGFGATVFDPESDAFADAETLIQTARELLELATSAEQSPDEP